MEIAWPAFALVALTAWVMLRLARLRFSAVAGGRVDPRFYKIFRGDGEPEEVAAVALLVSLGSAYVALRVLHSAIHLGTNRVLRCFRAFAASWLVLIAYWAVLGMGLARSSGHSVAVAG